MTAVSYKWGKLQEKRSTIDQTTGLETTISVHALSPNHILKQIVISCLVATSSRDCCPQKTSSATWCLWMHYLPGRRTPSRLVIGDGLASSWASAWRSATVRILPATSSAVFFFLIPIRRLRPWCVRIAYRSRGRQTMRCVSSSSSSSSSSGGSGSNSSHYCIKCV